MGKGDACSAWRHFITILSWGAPMNEAWCLRSGLSQQGLYFSDWCYVPDL
jgi:hypothetical protein